METLFKRHTTDAVARAEEMVAAYMQRIENSRVRKGISMRSLSAAAGLRPTTYWGIIQSPKNMRKVKASTLYALAEAIGGLPSNE